MKKFAAYVPMGIICIGIILRLREYAANRSLWVDEAFIALNIIHKSYRQLLGQLDYLQHAPFVFLWIERGVTQLLGTGEYALRFFPLACGIVGLVLFYRLSRKVLDAGAATVALTVFALSDLLIYYSAEVKQYSLDVLVGILVYLVLLHKPRKGIVVLAGLGAMFLIHPAIFILAGIGLVFALRALGHKNYVLFWQWAGIGAVWAAAYAVYYAVFVRGYFDNSLFLTYWQYVVLFPAGVADIRSNTGGAVSLFIQLLGTPSYILGLVTAGVGAAALFKKNSLHALLLAAPIGITWIASGLHLYPFAARLWLFLVPAVIIYIAEGSVVVFGHLGSSHSLYLKSIAWVIFPVLFYGSVRTAIVYTGKPRMVEEMRPVAAYYQAHKRDGDRTYIYYAAKAPFLYYQERLHSTSSDIVFGVQSRDNWEAYKTDVDTLRGNARVWILFSHAIIPEDAYITQYLDTIGRRIDVYQTTGASAYLYALR